MPIIAFVKEHQPGERRCALMPGNVKAYRLLGVDVLIEPDLGKTLHLQDLDYQEAGALVASGRKDLLQRADMVFSIHPLPLEDIKQLDNKLLVSFLDPFNNTEYLEAFNQRGVTSLSMEMIPRISRCQKMDALSSQASLAGYAMVLLGMSYLNSVLPMMMTPAGTIKPAKVFVIGAGVAGLQAIATAKRLGAAVTAFDTRAEVAEQVQSLGAKFLEINLGETGQTAQGYAVALTPEQMQMQKEQQAKCIADSDLVITTAQLFGRKPPKLIDTLTLSQMKPGSVIVDMAAESGGNVEGSVAGQVVELHGVSVVGTGNWSNEVAKDASQMYSNNLFNLFNEFCDKPTGEFNLDLTDEILEKSIITHGGETVNAMILKHLQKEVV